MKISIYTVNNTNQAKLSLKDGDTVIKIPSNLSEVQKIELRNKLMKIADDQQSSKEFLKLYYKIGTPFMFLNRKVNPNKKETIKVYEYATL